MALGEPLNANGGPKAAAANLASVVRRSRRLQARDQPLRIAMLDRRDVGGCHPELMQVLVLLVRYFRIVVSVVDLL
jgi:hypothetical protein